MYKLSVAAAAAITLVVAPSPLIAQQSGSNISAAAQEETGPAATQAEEIPSPAGLVMPQLEFTSTPEIEADFDKYFYFHRDGTTFEEAYADIRECDALASGSSIYMGGDPGAIAGAGAVYGLLPAAIGGAIGGAVADAIFGSAARRAQRRVSLRNCMNFKQYKRYGLSRDLWTQFNFEEGLGRKREPVRLHALALQALVASGPEPKTKELGL